MPLPILSTSRLFSIGSKPLTARPVHAVLLKAGLSALVGLGVLSSAPVSAHDVEVSPTLAPTATIAAQLAPSVLQQRGHAGTLDWTDGVTVDGGTLLENWQKNGVSADQAWELMTILVWTQSPVVVTTSAQLERAQQQSLATQAVLDVKTQADAQEFLRTNGLQQLVKRNAVSYLEATVSLPTKDSVDWNDVRVQWTKFSSKRLDQPWSVSVSTPTQYQQATSHLLRAVDSAGLASLRVPLPVWTSAQQVEELAARIDQANATMQHLTGWQGKVLGLNNSVALTVVKPADASVTYQPKNGQISISSAWEDLSHEWLHAMQAVMAQKAAGNNAQITKMFAFGEQGGLKNTWGGVLSNLKTISNQQGEWVRNLTAYVQEAPNAKQPANPTQWTSMDDARAYYTSPSEMMAYAWGSYVQSQLSSTNVLSPQTRAHQMADGVVGPSVEEAQKMKGVWTTTLAQLNTSWWSNQQPVVSLKTKLALRRQEAVVPAVALAR